MEDRLDTLMKQSQDNFNRTYVMLQEITTFTRLQSINDLDDQYQKQDENGIQCTLDNTRISTTMSASPMRYDLQGIYNCNKQYREPLHIVEAHATACTHPIRLLEIATPPLHHHDQTPDNPPTFRPTDETVRL
eukprot:scaffold86750_cov60-Attheya_sp.AAC.2